MNYEAISVPLRRMTEEAHMATITLKTGKLPAPGSAGYEKIMRMIETSAQRMTNIRAGLKSQAGLLDLQYGARHGGPRDYSARQSYIAKQDNIATLYAAAGRLAEALLELYRVLHGPDNPGHVILNGLKHGLKGFRDGADTEGYVSGPAAQELQMVIGQIPEVPGAPRELTPGTAIDLFTVCLGLYALIRHKMTRKG